MSIEDKLTTEKEAIDKLLVEDPILSTLKEDRIEYKREKYYKIQEELLANPILKTSEDRDVDSFVSLRDLSIGFPDRQTIYLLKRIEELEARIVALEKKVFPVEVPIK